MEADIERMYRAGRVDMPAAAERLSRITTNLHDRLGVLDTQSALAGDPQVLRSMLQVGGDVYDVTSKAIGTLNDCAIAVIKTADDFRATDQDARDDYNRMDSRLRETPNPTESYTPPSLGNPEDPGAPGTPSTPDPVDPSEDRYDRDHKNDEPEKYWGQ